MIVKRRIHAGQVYLGKQIMESLNMKDGDEVIVEARNGVVIIRPVRSIDEHTKKLLLMLEKTELMGSSDDYFQEYDYEDIGE